MQTITIIPTYNVQSQLIEGVEYRRVTATDTKNRYIDMRNWGFECENGWVETNPLTLDEIVPSNIIDEWSDRWQIFILTTPFQELVSKVKPRQFDTL